MKATSSLHRMSNAFISPCLKIGCAIMLLISTQGQASTLTWSGSSNGLWSDSTNWGGTAVPAAGDTADFGTRTLSGGMTIDLSGGATVGTINLGDLGSSKIYTLKSTASGGSVLTLDNGSSNSRIVENLLTGGDSIASTVTLSIAGNGYLDITNYSTKAFSVNSSIVGTATTGNTNTVTITNASTGTTTISGLYDGSNGGKLNVVLAAGSSTINLSNNSGTSLTGAVEVKSGTVKMLWSGSLGSVASTGAAVTIDSGGTVDINGKLGVLRNFVLNGTGSTGKGAIVNSSATGASLNSANTVQLATDAGVGAVSGSSLTLAGAISGTGALLILDSGTVYVAHANTYTGGTQVQFGTLVVTGTGSTLGSGDITVFSGATLSLLSLNAVADSAKISFTSTSLINLGFTGTETIGALDLDGTYIGIGTYTATQLNSFFGISSGGFSGSGLFNVTAIPEPSCAWLLLLGIILHSMHRRRLIA